MSFGIITVFVVYKAVTRALIGGGKYSYIRVLPDEFLLKSTLMTTHFKRNSSGRTRKYEYSPPPPPPINALVTVLVENEIHIKRKTSSEVTSYEISIYYHKLFISLEIDCFNNQ